MREESIRIAWERVTHYLGSTAGRTLDIGDPAHLTALVDAVRPALKEVVEDELWLTVAMCWLGPPTAGIPPTAMWRELHKLLCQMTPDAAARVSRVMECAIAYGCGKWREIPPGAGGWEHRWQGAMRGLVRAMEPAIAQANRWLAAHVVGFPKPRENSQAEAFAGNTADWSDAWLLGMRFVRPEKAFTLQDNEELILECTTIGTELAATEQDYRFCIPPGAKALWTMQENATVVDMPHGQTLPLPAHATLLAIARDDDVILKVATENNEQQTRLRMDESATLMGPATLCIRECTCGTTHCIERHRLAGWNPLQKVQKTDANEATSKTEGFLTLWDCLASAVKGPQANVKTGAFVQGMYFPLLAQEGLQS